MPKPNDILPAEPVQNKLSGFILWICAIFCGIFALFVFTKTLTPAMPTTDGGELITAAWLPGVAHSPGFPLWTMLAWLFSHGLPLGDIVWRINWLSAVLGAATTIVLFWLLWLFAKPVDLAAPKKLVVIITTVLCFIFSRTFWSWSTITEVYALHIFLAGLVLLLVWLWSSNVQNKDIDPARNDRYLILAAFISGLGLGNHHVSMIFLAPAIFYLLWSNKERLTVKTLLYCSLGLFLGLLVYLYLPLCSTHRPLLNWGDPSNLERFWWHISGKQYQVNFFKAGPAGVFKELGQAALLLLNQFSPFLVPVWLLGGYLCWKQDRKFFWFCLLVIVFVLLYVSAYEISEDRDAYYLSVFLLLAFWLASGLSWLLNFLEKKYTRLLKFSPVLIVLLPLLLFIWNKPFADHSNYDYAAVYTKNALNNIEDNAVILTNDWQLYSPALAVQNVLNQHKGILILDMQLFQNRSWYFLQLQQMDPQLYQKLQPEIEPFLGSLRKFETGKLIPGDNSIWVNYQNLLKALLKNISSRPVYLTPDQLSYYQQFKVELGTKIVPSGVLLRLNPTSASLPPLNWEISSLQQAAQKRFALDLATKKILYVHALLAYLRGGYLMEKGLTQEAETAFALSNELDPSIQKMLSRK